MTTTTLTTPRTYNRTGRRLNPAPGPLGADVLADLRQFVPYRGLSVAESLRIAELQATKLMELAELVGPPVRATVATDLLGFTVIRRPGWPTSGAATQTGSRWNIVVAAEEPATRQRFTVLHEVKHILDDPFIDRLYPPSRYRTSDERAEWVSNFFAACFLMPRQWIKRDWGNGIQDLDQLARRYHVSRVAMGVRLAELKLIGPVPRNGGSRREGIQ